MSKEIDAASVAFAEAMKNPQFKKAYERELKRIQSMRGAKGGKKTLQNHGRSHFSKISSEGWKKRRKTIKKK